MSKKIIAVDVDDVLVPHLQDLIEWYNGEYGTRLTLADGHTNDSTNWGTTDITEAIRRVHRFYETDTFRNAQPYEQAKRALAKLAQRYNLVVITARDTIIEEATREWIDQHFKEVFQGVHFTAEYSLEGKNRSKGDVCAEIGAQYLIDDDIKNILDARQAGTLGVVFENYPWSQVSRLPEGVTRCKDWAAVLEYFDGRD